MLEPKEIAAALSNLDSTKSTGHEQIPPKIFKIKVENDHRSKFSNLSNWKEEA